MARDFLLSEGTAARRRFPVYLVDATDGITAETGEAGGQPQISKQGGAFANTTATLTAIGNGAYYVELTATELNTLGLIVVRYKSANTAEFNMDGQVVGYDPGSADISGGVISGKVWDELRSNHVVAGSFGLASQLVRDGTAQAGAAGSITLDAGASATDNLYNGAIVAIYAGTGAGQARQGVSYVGSTKVLTIDTNWTTNPDGTSKFVLFFAPVAAQVPANFSLLSIDGSGRVDLGKWIGTAPLALTSQLVQAQANQLGAQAKLDVNAEVDGALDTPIPAATANSINERIKTMDDADIPGRLPATLLGGNMRSNVQAMAADVIDNTALAASAVDEILDDPIEGSLTLRQALRVILSAAAGKSNSHQLGTPKYRDQADGKDRISATTDANGNRTAVTIDGT